MTTVVIVALVGLVGLLVGILIGRYYVPDDRGLKRSARHASTYIRALNDLLARDTGATIDKLKGVVSDNTDDVEPYFALAALFREQGDWERAIRVHQAIALRDGESPKTALRVEYELGRDYRSAGMPRRAMRAMETCLDRDARHRNALQALCVLYEEQGRFADAAEKRARLTRLIGDQPGPRYHHLLCAAAQRAVELRDHDAAKRHLREARKSSDPDEPGVHYRVAAAELAAARHRFAEASDELESALAAAPELAPFLVPGLVAAQRELAVQRGDADDDPASASRDLAEYYDERAARGAAEVIERILARAAPSAHLELALAEQRSHFDPDAALYDYRRIAEDFPDLLPARVAAARLALAGEDPDEIRRELRLLAAAGGVLDWATDGSYRCGRCGQRDEEFFWRCKSCRAWGTVRLDLGRAAHDVPAPRPREPRALPRGGVHTALMGAAAARALPGPTIAGAPGSEPLADDRESVLGRMGSWLSGAWSGLRGGKKPSEAGEAVPEGAARPALPAGSATGSAPGSALAPHDARAIGRAMDAGDAGGASEAGDVKDARDASDADSAGDADEWPSPAGRVDGDGAVDKG